MGGVLTVCFLLRLPFRLILVASFGHVLCFWMHTQAGVRRGDWKEALLSGRYFRMIMIMLIKSLVGISFVASLHRRAPLSDCTIWTRF